jgi:hypothetical protein
MGALNIKDAKVAAKARRLARLKGTSITAAVSEALEASLQNAARKSMAGQESREREVDEIVKRFKASLKRGTPSPWQVLDDLYDDSGSPR